MPRLFLVKFYATEVFYIRDTSKSGRPFVLTSAVKKSFEVVELAVRQRWPVLLYGPAGAGKTALIGKLAHSQGSQGMLSSNLIGIESHLYFLYYFIYLKSQHT